MLLFSQGPPLLWKPAWWNHKCASSYLKSEVRTAGAVVWNRWDVCFIQSVEL